MSPRSRRDRSRATSDTRRRAVADLPRARRTCTRAPIPRPPNRRRERCSRRDPGIKQPAIGSQRVLHGSRERMLRAKAIVEAENARAPPRLTIAASIRDANRPNPCEIRHHGDTGSPGSAARLRQRSTRRAHRQPQASRSAMVAARPRNRLSQSWRISSIVVVRVQRA